MSTVQHGGSYRIDPKTGEATLISRTQPREKLPPVAKVSPPEPPPAITNNKKQEMNNGTL